MRELKEQPMITTSSDLIKDTEDKLKEIIGQREIVNIKRIRRMKCMEIIRYTTNRRDQREFNYPQARMYQVKKREKDQEITEIGK